MTEREGFDQRLERMLDALSAESRHGRSPSDLARTWRHVTDASMKRVEPWLRIGVVVGYRAQLLEALGVLPEHLSGVHDPLHGALGPAFSRGACDVHHVRRTLRAFGRAVPTPPAMASTSEPDPLDRWVMRRLGANDESSEED